MSESPRAGLPSGRVASIDLIRGTMMALMAIDHAVAMVILFFARRWFARVKATPIERWLRYV